MRSFLRKAFILVAKVSLREIKTSSLKRNIYNNIRIILIENLNEENLNSENKSKVKVYYF